MPKRDYKSYNILEEELAQEVAHMEQNSQISNMPTKEDVSEKNRKEMGYDDIDEGNLKVKSENVDKASSKIKNEQNTESQQIEDSEKRQTKNEQEVKQEQKSKKSPILQIKTQGNNSDFPAYKRYYQEKERSNLFKGLMWIAKLTILIMLLPFIGTIAIGVLVAVGCVAVLVLGSIGLGVFILGAICFMATQLSIGLIALGISASATLISFGGIVFILFIMFTKWLIELFNKYLKPCNIKKKESK